MREPPTAEQLPFPDLLHAVPLRTIDVDSVNLGLVFAFAGSTSGGLFSDALNQAKVAPSTWEPECFADDLFLKDLVRTCFQVNLGGGSAVLSVNHLIRVLAAPPSELQTVEFRRWILSELIESPALRQALEQLYRGLNRFRGLLEGTSASGKWDQNSRQLDLLRLVQKLIEGLVSGFGGARSGLSRLAEFGRRVESSEPYRALLDLLQYDEQFAAVNLKLRIGADGRVRSLELVTVEENTANPFMQPPWRRWLAKLELFARGFRFGDGEVMARLLDAVFEGLRHELVSLVQLVGDLEFYLGALGFYDRTRAAGLPVCFPELVTPEQPRELLGLFNPLLLGSGLRPVPCDIVTDRHDTTLLVTGPNSGGKTRLLQSVGLAQLLAQSGLFVPARAARMAPCAGLVVSLIQETRADQTEGRLGIELMRIRALFERLPPGALVLLDELCSGTNPSEGEEIVELVIRTLTRLRPQGFITTHFLEFAARLERERKIADLRFLQVVLGPEQEATYQFAQGVASTSLAARAAARLGVTAEQLLMLVETKLATLPR
jgi:DNA mismatch repair protein MutS2